MSAQEDNLYEYQIEGQSGIYNLAWPNLRVSAHVAYMKNESNHETKGEVTFRSERPTAPGHLFNGRLNFTSPTAKKTFAKAIAERDDQVDWGQVVEQLCMGVMSRHRAGSPVITLTGNVDTKQFQKWLVHPLIPLREPTVIYAPGATFKSYLALYIAVLVDAGMSHNGLNVERAASVLYCDWETSSQELNIRATLLRRGLGIEGECSIQYRSMTQGLADDIERIKEICLDDAIDFIVIDSIGQACGAEPESAAVVLNFFTKLRELGISSLCIDHTNKANDSKDAKNLFGSVYKYNQARQILQAKTSQQEGSNKFDLVLLHVKANNSGKMKPNGFRIEFVKDSDGDVEKVLIDKMNVRDSELEEHMMVVDRIQNALRNVSGGLSVAQLVEELEKSENHIRKELSKGKEKGLFVQLPTGNYANRVWEQDIVQEAKQIFEEEESWRF